MSLDEAAALHEKFAAEGRRNKARAFIIALGVHDQETAVESLTKLLEELAAYSRRRGQQDIWGRLRQLAEDEFG